VKAARIIVASIGLAWVLAAGCAGQHTGEKMGPVITMYPDEFVLRDLRRDAAPLLRCQSPNIQVALDAWAGSEGNVVAAGCGYQVNYYLRCITNHQCSKTLAD
jgi:hypothetical protein